ncbi:MULTISPECIES: PTS system mannose/fructose/sorbose family transporter subunit IID [Jeongeupia]|uniref:PTS system mannose/fructose/sorbose family transporter subunit IID n=2 Tax=Jeongeupia TaxID=885864 RepID=A0ABS2BMS9_9NEIS|nr:MULTISPECIES: PTS system mannose/fructose/sorbose family transporter subunit IID [Jeongeupia]MBM3116925.1 PTS system mannose/fructose/sorbose family transporter subunit IID [Jeongeupia naejangsanensis]GHD68449.1 PTS fructose transporter subunit IID [Jeongeupia chitinilytica]
MNATVTDKAVSDVQHGPLLTKADITKSWLIYYMGAEVSNSYERLQSLIFCASMTPVLKKLYPNKEEQAEALKRHLNFFNTEGVMGGIIQGVAIAMEEQKTRGEPITDSSIIGIKTGLMGALAGVGDSIIWAALMPLLIALFIPFAAKGSAMGGIAPLVLYTGITIGISYALCHKGYKLGRESIVTLLQGGKIKELIYGANVLGLIMMGALAASYVKLSTPLKFSFLQGSEVVVQQVLDSIVPGLLPLAAVFAIYLYMLKKGPRYTVILLSVVAFSLVCSITGIL